MISHYYQHLLNFHALFDFLTLRGRFPLSQREIALRYPGDKFKRYEKFDSNMEAENYCLEHNFEYLGARELRYPLIFYEPTDLQQMCIETQPLEIHAGCVYPSRNRSLERQNEYMNKFAPVVFDVDMEDLLQAGSVRNCDCEPRTVCNECWQLIMTPCMIDLHDFLASMGFESLLFVFSGRRGFHCYIMDHCVWSWTSDQRRGLVMRLPKALQVDERVTTDVTHMCKVPLVPHHATGLVACPIGNLYTFRPQQDAVHYSEVKQEQMDKWSKEIYQKMN